MHLPEHCSIRVGGEGCQLAPAYAVSVVAEDGEYMLAVVCEEHRDMLEARLGKMQYKGKVRKGRIKFDSVKTVVTDCVVGMNDDYVDLELKRGIDSDRQMG